MSEDVRGAYETAGALPAQRHAFLAAGAALAAGFAAFAATSGKAERFLRWGLPLLTLLAAAELSYQGARLYAWDPPDRLYVQTPLVRFLRGRPLPFRVVGEGSMFFPNVSVFAGVEDVRTHDPAERRDYVEFLDATCGYDPTPYFKTIVNVNAPGLDFLNTRYLIAAPGRTAPSEKWTRVYDGPDGTVFENARVMPRVFAPARVRVVRKQASGMLPTPAGEAYGTPFHELFGDVDWHREALVLDDGRGGFRAAELAAEGRVEVSDYAETTNTVRFRSRVGGAPGGATLVTSLVEDGGWRGRDENGAPIALARANGPFLALHVASGDHSVRLDYASPGFRLGRAVSLASLLLGALAAAASKRRPAGAS